MSFRKNWLLKNKSLTSLWNLYYLKEIAVHILSKRTLATRIPCLFYISLDAFVCESLSPMDSVHWTHVQRNIDSKVQIIIYRISDKII